MSEVFAGSVLPCSILETQPTRVALLGVGRALVIQHSVNQGSHSGEWRLDRVHSSLPVTEAGPHSKHRTLLGAVNKMVLPNTGER